MIFRTNAYVTALGAFALLAAAPAGAATSFSAATPFSERQISGQASADTATGGKMLLAQEKMYPPLEKGSSGGPNFTGPDGKVKMKSQSPTSVQPSNEQKFPSQTKGSSGDPSLRGAGGDVKMKSSAGAASPTPKGKYPAPEKDSGGDPNIKAPAKQ